MRDLFPGYYRPNDAEFERLWREAVFTFDTNILLHIYRFTDDTRERLFTILERLHGRVWVGHQAALEFQRNRLEVISGGTKLYSELRRTMGDFEQVLQKHRIHPYLQEARAIVAPAVTSLHRGLETLEERHPDLLKNDPLRDRLTELLTGRVGSPFDSETLKKHLQEAKTRAEAGHPPGFVDYRKKKDRPEAERCGDVLLWFQIMDYAKAQQKPIILVTDDKKEDWWLEHLGRTVGPHPLLIDEMAQGPGVAFYMYTSERFLEEAARFLDLEALPRSVTEAKSVREELQEYALAMATDEQRRMFKLGKAMAAQSLCQSNLKQLGLLAMQYVADYGHFPHATTWNQDLAQYLDEPLSDAELSRCPSDPARDCEGHVSYAMNAGLSEVNPDDLENYWTYVLFFDSSADSPNACGGEEMLCLPARHIEGNNICFADGHVETVDPQRGKLLRWSASDSA